MAATPPHSPDEVENTSVNDPFQLSPRGDDSSGSGGTSGSVGAGGSVGASGASGGSSAGSNAPVLYRQFSTDSDNTATATTITNNNKNHRITSANTNTNTDVTTTTTTTKTQTNRLEIIEQVRTNFCIDCTQHIVLKRANTYLYSEIFPCDVLNR